MCNAVAVAVLQGQHNLNEKVPERRGKEGPKTTSKYIKKWAFDGDYGFRISDAFLLVVPGTSKVHGSYAKMTEHTQARGGGGRG